MREIIDRVSRPSTRMIADIELVEESRNPHPVGSQKMLMSPVYPAARARRPDHAHATAFLARDELHEDAR